jgi:CRP-like cAMP-binding protein
MEYFDYDEDGAGGSQNEQITVLEGLSEDEWQMIIRSAQTIPFSKGDILLKEGESDDAVYIVVSGQVEVISGQAFGRKKRLATIDEGSVFGEVAFFDTQPRSASVRATGDGQVLRLSRKGFEKISAWNPTLAQQFLFDLGSILAYRFRSEFPYKI